MAHISIYITNLGKYNEGELVGKWVDLPLDEEEFEKVYAEICIDNVEYEEVFITDYETDLEGLKINEYDNIDDLNYFAEELDRLDEDELIASQAYMLNECNPDTYSVIDFAKRGDYVVHEADSLEDLASNYVEEVCPDLPSFIRYHLDYSGIARDMQMDGTYVEIDEYIVEIY